MKKILGVLVLFVTAIMLTACGDKDESPKFKVNTNGQERKKYNTVEEMYNSMENATGVNYAMTVESTSTTKIEGKKITVSTYIFCEIDGTKSHTIIDMPIFGELGSIETYNEYNGTEYTSYMKNELGNWGKTTSSDDSSDSGYDYLTEFSFDSLVAVSDSEYKFSDVDTETMGFKSFTLKGDLEKSTITVNTVSEFAEGEVKMKVVFSHFGQVKVDLPVVTE